ncbi:MAG: enoyl-CoA hydratase/isomerase family protein [Chloroflexi bacterium]|nr:enoyl-CoA hydratase/isomerase family protein [Chloroflexota bacterium]
MAYENIKFEMAAEHVALVTLNRPKSLNALNKALWEELQDAVNRIETDTAIRVYLITGAPREEGRPWFSAGADLKARATGGPAPHWLANGVVNQIDDMLKPSIAVIDGFCTTGGMELIMACDLRIAAETASFSDWHLKSTGAGIGGWGAATRLARLVGTDKAKEMLLTGLTIDGREAARIGLVNRAVPSASLMATALDTAKTIAGMRPDGVKLTLGFLTLQSEMDKHQALRWAEITPKVMGIERAFKDMTERFIERNKE